MLVNIKKYIDRAFRWLAAIDVVVGISFVVYLLCRYIYESIMMLYTQMSIWEFVFYCSLIILVALYVLSFILELIVGDSNDEDKNSAYY